MRPPLTATAVFRRMPASRIALPFRALAGPAQVTSCPAFTKRRSLKIRSLEDLREWLTATFDYRPGAFGGPALGCVLAVPTRDLRTRGDALLIRILSALQLLSHTRCSSSRGP